MYSVLIRIGILIVVVVLRQSVDNIQLAVIYVVYYSFAVSSSREATTNQLLMHTHMLLDFLKERCHRILY